MSNEAVKYGLIALTGWGIYSVWMFSFTNGSLSMMEAASLKKVLPGTNHPMLGSVTGVEAIDHQLAVLIAFFWPAIDGSNPDLSLYSFNSAGQAAACWMVVLVEALRAGNRWRPISFLATAGLILQNATFAATFPIFLALHMFTSPTVSSVKTDLYTIDPVQLEVLPFSLLIGYVAPTIAMCLPTPSVVSLDTKQYLENLWQPWPLWVYIAQLILAPVFSVFMATKKNPSLEEKKRDTIRGVRSAYFTGYGLATLTHIASWSVSLAALVFPKLFASDYATVLHPARVFLNTAPWSDAKAASIAQGGLWFLQWDMVTGSAALLLWSANLWVNTQNQIGSYPGWGQAIKRVILWTLLAGPCGAAVGLMWERDELLLGEGQDGRKTK